MKLVKKSNYRIVVEPTTHFYGIKLNDDIVLGYLKNIEDQIKRHVDNVRYVGIECDTKEVCSYCSLGWEVSQDDSDPDFPKGTPCCCQQAIDEYNKGALNDLDLQPKETIPNN